MAQYNLGVLYDDGEGVPRTSPRRRRGSARPQTKGMRRRSTTSACSTPTAREFPRTSAQAAAWYRKAADQGHAVAQYNLGVLYRDGEGVPKDLAQAVAWFRKAADQGNAAAQNNLGVLYANGEGVPEGSRAGGDVVSQGRRSRACGGAVQPRRALRGR